MQTLERRVARRFFLKVPLRYKQLKNPADAEKAASAMNISRQGVYFATEEKVTKGLMVQVKLKMPNEIAGNQVDEWNFTGRVARVEPLGSLNGMSGVGVQFLCYEAPPALI